MAARQKPAALQSSGAPGAGGLQPPERAFAGYAQLQQRAQHHGWAAALAGSAPAFPGTAQLARRWVAAHMLSSQARACRPAPHARGTFSVFSFKLPLVSSCVSAGTCCSANARKFILSLAQ